MFEKSVFIENIKKNWWIMLIVTILIFILIPANIAIDKNDILENQQYMEQLGNQLNDSYILELSNNYIQNSIETRLFTNINYIIILIVPVLISMQLFARNREQNKEKKVYITNLFTQIIILVVPFFINAIVLAVLKLAGGFLDELHITSILYWFATNVITSLIILAIANLIAALTKNKITHILTTYILLFVPIVILVVFESLLTQVIFGYPGFSNTTLSIIGEYPTAKILNLFVYNYEAQSYETNFTLLHGVIYLIISVGLMYGAYKIKNIYGLVQKIIKYIITFMVMALAYICFSYIFGTEVIPAIISLITAVVAYIVTEMIIKKTYKVVSSWKGIAVYTLISIIFYSIFLSNVFGYETNVPEAENVEYALYSMTEPSENNKNVYYREKENIQFIIDKQKEQIENKNTPKDYDNKTYEKFYIKYKLKDGKEITRTYEIEPLYVDLYDSDEFIKQRYAYIFDENETENISTLKIIGTYDKKIFEIDFVRAESQDKLKEVVEAVKKDIDENKIYKADENAYNQFSEKEGLQYITIDVYSDLYISQDYVSYLKINDEYELVKIIQKLIDEESDMVKWEE